MSAKMSYPFPVLGNADDVVGDPSRVDLVHKVTGTDVDIQLTPGPLRTGNASIDCLVSDKKAKWYFRIHCARTYFRKEFELDPANPSVRLSTDRVEGGILGELFVVAVENLASYRPDGIHPDYGDSSFNVMPGEVLGVAWEFEFTIEPRFDPMKADARSLIRFVKEEGQVEGPFRLDLDSDTIVVYIPEKEWDLVYQVKDDVPELLHTCVALPALIAAISRREPNDTRKWASRLTALLQQKNISDGDPVEAAQRLLENPLLRGLAQVDSFLRPE